MIETAGHLISFLIEHELLDPQQVLDGRLSVRDVSRRNRNYKVVCDNGPSFLVKQSLDSAAASSVRLEADVYRHLLSSSPALRSCTPGFRFFEPREQVLVIELLPEAEDLRRHYGRLRSFSSRLGAAAGRTLRALHSRSDIVAGSTAWMTSLSDEPPWCLSLHRPSRASYRDLSYGKIELIKVIQSRPELCRFLEELRQGWRSACLIHGDIKWDNFVLARTHPGRGQSLNLIDWEYAGMGDPLWDAGSVLGSYLNSWITSIPVDLTHGQEPSPELATMPLASMLPAISAFWHAYASNHAEDPAMLMQAVRYAGAKLLEFAFIEEQSQTQLTRHAVLLLQLALNVMQRPQDAAMMLGLADSTAP